MFRNELKLLVKPELSLPVKVGRQGIFKGACRMKKELSYLFIIFCSVFVIGSLMLAFCIAFIDKKPEEKRVECNDLDYTNLRRF